MLGVLLGVLRLASVVFRRCRLTALRRPAAFPAAQVELSTSEGIAQAKPRRRSKLGRTAHQAVNDDIHGSCFHGASAAPLAKPRTSMAAHIGKRLRRKAPAASMNDIDDMDMENDNVDVDAYCDGVPATSKAVRVVKGSSRTKRAHLPRATTSSRTKERGEGSRGRPQKLNGNRSQRVAAPDPEAVSLSTCLD